MKTPATLITLLTTVLFLCAALPSFAAATLRSGSQPVDLPLKGRTIMIDPGHGGVDPGTSNQGFLEKDITLSIALKLKVDLERLGAKVIMTRDRDATVSLDERVDMTNALKPDIFVSVHVNASSDHGVAGVETYFFTPQSRPLASALFHALVSGLQCRARWIAYNNLHVIDHTRIPASLAEVGFLSNARERKLLVSDSYQQRIADALSRGIVDYFARPGGSPSGH